MQNSTLFLVFSLLLTLGACSPQKDSAAVNDPLESSYRLMDQGKTNEALEKLEDLLKRDSRPEIREALASAYAERAGIRISQFLDVAASFQSGVANSNEGPLPQTRDRIYSDSPFGQMLARLQTSPEFANNSELRKMIMKLLEFDLWMQKLSALPVVQANQITDLNRAIKVLENARPGGRLYRALLGLVVYKSDFVLGFSGWPQLEGILKQIDFENLTADSNMNLVCQQEFKVFSTWLGGLVTKLKVVAEDLSKATPSRKTELDEAIKKISETSRQLRVFLGVTCQP